MQPQPQQQNLLARWASRVAPVADLVLSGLRIGTNSGFQGGLSAKLELSSGLLVNLQLLGLCKSPATCASAAGVYLPSGYAVPSDCRSSSGPNPAAGAAADGPACLAANYNAFVLAPYTSRLTAAYQSATLHRWQLLGLSRLVADQSQAGSGSAAARGQLRGQGPSCASSGTSAGQQPQGGMLSRGWISRRQLLRHRWQRVLELRAFVKSMDYAMFLVFHQAAHQGAAADPVSSSSSGSISACEPGASTPAEQYQMLYRMYLAELDAAAEKRQPTDPQQAGWFGSRRSTCITSVGGVPLHSAPAAAASAASAAVAPAAAAAASAGSSPAAASAATAGSLPGSPSIVMLEQGVYDWRRGHMRDTFRHRLSTAERAQSAHSSPSISRDGSSGSSTFYGHISGDPLAATSSLGSAQLSGGSSASLHRRPSAAPVKLRDGGHSFTGADANGLPPVAERAGSAASCAPPAPTAQQVAASRTAAKVAAGALPVSTSASGSGGQGLRSDSFSSDGSSQPAAAAAGGSPMAGMQMFNALRSLRSGSSFILGAAAQQLRLRKRQGQQQQQQQHQVQQQQQHARAPSRLGPRPVSSAAAAAAQEQHSVQSPRQQQLPQGWHTQGVSSFAAAGPLFSEASLGAAGQAHTQQQQQPLQPWEVMLDFLSAFAVFEDFLNRPVSTAAAGGGGFRVLAPSSRQPQLSLSFLQQPATSQQQRQQVEQPSAAAAAAALGRERTLAAKGEALDDQLTLGLGHLKVILGPHSVSMGLQLMTSLLDAATAARQSNPHSTSSSRHGSTTGAAAAASPATPIGSSGSRSGRTGTGLNVRLQLAVCHVALNMERMAAADRVRGGTLGGVRQPQQRDLLETKGLLSLLLLDANSSVQRRPAAAGSAGRGTHTGGMRVSCSVAHAGLQDLCAPLEQRHVLSGSREPYKVSWMSRFSTALFCWHAVLPLPALSSTA